MQHHPLPYSEPSIAVARMRGARKALADPSHDWCADYERLATGRPLAANTNRRRPWWKRLLQRSRQS